MAEGVSRRVVEGLDELEKVLEVEGGNKRTLTQDFATLQEFDDSESPDLLALYFHYRDQSFDCFNAREFQEQMVAYLQAGHTVRANLPRLIGEREYMLVCLQSKDPEKDSLCQVAFQAKRQFCGTSMLVKKRCFVCNRVGAQRCTGCHVASFCDKVCLARGWGEHKRLCKMIKAGEVTLETEAIQLKPG